MVLEKTLESPLDCKEIQPVHPKGNQSWIFTGRTDAEAEAPVVWPPNVKSWLIRKDPEAEKDWRQEEKGTTEDEMVGWHHRLDGHEFKEALGVGDWQGGLACYSLWGCKELGTTEWLNWTEEKQKILRRGGKNIQKNSKMILMTQIPCWCDHSPSNSESAVSEIYQARILEWIAISFSKTHL